jgi:hypothetical protein
VIDRLAGRAGQVAVATHDPVLAAEALGRLVAAGTPCELELLYGLAAGPVLAATRELGVPVRYYVPWGRGSLTFPLWRIAELRLLRALLGDLAGRRRRYPVGLQSSGDRWPPAASVRSASDGRPAYGGSSRGGLSRSLELPWRAAPWSRVPVPVP